MDKGKLNELDPSIWTQTRFFSAQSKDMTRKWYFESVSHSTNQQIHFGYTQNKYLIASGE